MTLSRRDFVKLCTGTVAGIGISQMFHPAVKEVFAQVLSGERPPVFWVQGQGCTGCTMTLLNNVHPGIAELLLKVINLEFHPTVMGHEGEGAYEHLLRIAAETKGKYIVAVEGAIPVKKDGRYCVIAEAGHKEITMVSAMKEIAGNAAAMISVGTCSAYGGIPAARNNITGATSLRDFLKKEGIKTPVINVPGCPPHPDWIVGTAVLAIHSLATNTLDAFVKSELDMVGRPKAFYGRNVHMNCPYRDKFDEGKMSETMTDKSGCRYLLGCKGPTSACDSFERMWNNRSNWCINNATCIGCTSPNFPDGKSPFYVN